MTRRLASRCDLFELAQFARNNFIKLNLGALAHTKLLLLACPRISRLL